MVVQLGQSHGGSGGSGMGFIDSTWGSGRASVGDVDILLRHICTTVSYNPIRQQGTDHGDDETGRNPG